MAKISTPVWVTSLSSLSLSQFLKDICGDNYWLVDDRIVDFEGYTTIPFEGVDIRLEGVKEFRLLLLSKRKPISPEPIIIKVRGKEWILKYLRWEEAIGEFVFDCVDAEHSFRYDTNYETVPMAIPVLRVVLDLEPGERPVWVHESQSWLRRVLGFCRMA